MDAAILNAPDTAASSDNYAQELASAGGGSLENLLSSDDSPSTEDTQQDSTEQQPETSGQQPEAAQTDPEGDAPKEADGLLQQVAEMAGLDPNDPNHRATLEKLIASDAFRQKFGTQAEPEQADEEQYLTEFERQMLNPKSEEVQQPAPAAAAPTQQASQTPAPLQFGDGFDKWTGPDDAYRDLNEAWAHAKETGDLTKVNGVEQALFTRRAHAELSKFKAAVIDPMLKQIEERLAPMSQVLPNLQTTIRNQEFEAAGRQAQADLGKVFGPEVIDKLGVAEPDSKPITFKGQQWPNTPFNRIVAKNPEILNIRVPYNDPKLSSAENERISERLTVTAQYRVVARHFKESQAQAPIQAQAAKALVQTGKKIAEAKSKERFRQGLNSGSPATGRGAGADPDMEFINALRQSNGSLSLDDLK